jgi:hypothetical protein
MRQICILILNDIILFLVIVYHKKAWFTLRHTWWWIRNYRKKKGIWKCVKNALREVKEDGF